MNVRMMRRYDRRAVLAVLALWLVLDTFWGDESCSCDRRATVSAIGSVGEVGNANAPLRS